MSSIRLAVKIDVDTERGTRLGVPALVQLLEEFRVPATFYLSLGPDNTGRALRRVLRPGFLKKVSRTSVVEVYGVRTLLNGVLWPGPHIARRHGALLRSVRETGFEVGIHCYDHVRWQDGVQGWSAEETQRDFGRALDAFSETFGHAATTAGAAGWQANAHSLAAYDAAGLLYASDVRGGAPFLPRCDGTVFKTLQIPGTLPTLDELLGLPEHPEDQLVDQYLGWLVPDALNVLTIHAEIEGMLKRAWFRKLLEACTAHGVVFTGLADEAQQLLADPAGVPTNDLLQGTIPGRSGTLAVQAPRA